MSAEENKQVARRFITAFLAGDTAVLEEIVVEGIVGMLYQLGLMSA